MPHVLHQCSEINGIEWGRSLNWPHREIPLNTDAGHTECPYCGTSVKDMELATNNHVSLLNGKSTGTHEVSNISLDDLKDLIRSALSKEQLQAMIRDVLKETKGTQSNDGRVVKKEDL